MRLKRIGQNLGKTPWNKGLRRGVPKNHPSLFKKKK